MARPRLSESVEVSVITESRRRCCICFGLDGDFSRKKGQIAHLDHDPANNDLGNLAFLCLDHHDEYDSRSSQAKGLKSSEVKIYRANLYHAVDRFLAMPVSLSATSAKPEEEVSENLLLAQGEINFYLAQYVKYRDQGVSAMGQIGQSLDRHNEAMEKFSKMTQEIGATLPGRRLKAINRAFEIVASDLTRFSEDQRTSIKIFVAATRRMLHALGRASVIFSDIEGATSQMLLPRIEELRSIRQLLTVTRSKVSEVKMGIKEWSRGPTEYNRGRRLVIVSLDEVMSEIAQIISEIGLYEGKLAQVLELM